MKKFMAIYMMPAAGLGDWMKTDPKTRKAAEVKMQGEWHEWMKKHTTAFTGITAGLGKTKRVTPAGVDDVKNDLMLYSVVEAESADAAAKIFEGHPHLGIPDAWIDVMEINPLPGMQM